MKPIFTHQKIFLEIGIFETKLITNFSNQKMIVGRYDEGFENIYPLDLERTFTDYKKLKKFTSKLISLIEDKSVVTSFLGLEAYILVSNLSQVELLALKDSLLLNGCRKFIFIDSKTIISRTKSHYMHLDLDNYQSFNPKKIEIETLFSESDLANIAKITVFSFSNKYKKTYSEDEVFRILYNFYVKPVSDTQSEESLSELKDEVDRAILGYLKFSIKSILLTGLPIKLSGNLIKDKKIYNGVLKVLGTLDFEVVDSDFILLEKLKEKIGNLTDENIYNKYKILSL